MHWRTATMSRPEPQQHVLTGFPEAAVQFVRALEQRRRRLAADQGLSESELRCLFRIGADGSVTPKELAAGLGVTKGAVTGITTRLVASGLVHRIEHPQDRRSLHLELTDAGHRSMRAMHRDLLLMLSGEGSDLSEQRLAEAGSVLREMTRRMASAPDA